MIVHCVIVLNVCPVNNSQSLYKTITLRYDDHDVQYYYNA